MADGTWRPFRTKDTKGTKDTKVTNDSFDTEMMKRALFHAARGQGRTSPNPMVGALVVSPDRVILSHGWHERAGDAHAEVNALDAVGESARGATLYVTLEPCCHFGRTPPCTRRVVAAGVARVVAAMRDPDPRVSGQGFAELRANGIDVIEGVCEAEARRLNAGFVRVRTHGRPLVLIKAATSLDAKVAAASGVRTQLTSRHANQKTHQLRAAIDAIAVGSETLRIDDPLLTARACQRERPLIRAVFDRRLRTSAKAAIFSTMSDGPVIIVTDSRERDPTRAAALESAGATILEARTLLDALHALVRWDVSTLLIEGGPQLQRAFLAETLVDRLHLIVAPQWIGEKGLPWLDVATLGTDALSHLTIAPRGPDMWIEADVHGNC